ncbi:hypothetical protein G6F29_006735 [Rhizopus arrhizus]|nr:hypothetical protein G6F24_006345 [Rhizopus arrhizus]KAG0815461.1 hypothetical protein G6F20_003975 [Rhizopus arrhizus]KAG0852872.1 hypothetical protein G6F17_007713 [Rhizopus arrhizus]KAG0874681.1 hypothetical protein G6F16_003594 [Rhizopus arrhizus]KAG0899312.1 hypothetical protein G6F34_004836 [Rhizopus arrhizus]
MSILYLPLVLDELYQPNDDLIRQTVSLAIAEKAKRLVIGIKSQEIKTHAHCLDAIWDKMQTVLGHIYVAQLNVAYEANEPLFDCNVVFEDVCGYFVHLEPNLTKVCLSEKDIVQVKKWNEERKEIGLNALEAHGLSSHPIEPVQLSNQKKAPGEPRRFERVAVGGTFDHLHAGHKILLTMTALLSEKSMVVGVTDDCMLIKKQHKDLIASTKDRIRQVETYLQSVKRSIQHQVVPIKDPFGPTVTDPTIDALVVSKETRKGGDLVNSERDLRGYPPLELRIIDVISTNSNSIEEKDMSVLKISSSWIREYLASDKK